MEKSHDSEADLPPKSDDEKIVLVMSKHVALRLLHALPQQDPLSPLESTHATAWGSVLSCGHVKLVPSQVSSTSHRSLLGRHNAVAGSRERQKR